MSEEQKLTETTLENPEATAPEAPSPDFHQEETQTPPTPAGETGEQESVIVTLQEEVATLKQQLESQNQQAELLKTQYIRMTADFENFRKRNLKEKEELEKQVKRNTLNELLSVVDNFERARTQIKPANDGEMGIHKSYQGVYKILVESLKRLGVTAMRPEGQPFDPSQHEAMLREYTDAYPEGTVIEQMVRGYLLGDQVLRHAMVKVAATPETVSPSEAETLDLENVELG
jgi:molecular chaperone GrpE